MSNKTCRETGDPHTSYVILICIFRVCFLDVVAGYEVAAANFPEGGTALGADRRGSGAAGAEGAAAGQIHGAGHVALKHDTLGLLGLVRVGDGHGGQQRYSVGVQRVAVQFRGGGHLHHLAKIHDRYPVGDVLYNRQIVGDEQVCEAQILLKLLQHIDDLGLNGHVQSGHRLVTDDKLGVGGQGAGNAYALALAAGELVGVPGGLLAGKSHGLQQLEYTGGPLRLVCAEVVHIYGLGHNVGHSHAGIQRGVGILKHKLGAAAELTQRLALFYLLAVEPDFTGGGLVQVHQRPAHGGLTTAGFTHQTQSFATVDGEGYVVDSLEHGGLEESGGNGEMHL